MTTTSFNETEIFQTRLRLKEIKVPTWWISRGSWYNRFALDKEHPESALSWACKNLGVCENFLKDAGLYDKLVPYEGDL